MTAAEDLLSYAVGIAFGRWDASLIAQSSDLSREVLFEEIPEAPPALVARAERAALPGPTGPIPRDGVLLDQPGHTLDIEAKTIAAVAQCGADTVLSDVLQVVRSDSVRMYMRKRFFKSHLARYSISRRKAPIYWPLYVPSEQWGIWLYAPTLSRETLFAITRAAAERLDAAEAEIRRLQRERDTGGAGRSSREVANVLASEEALAEELRRFRDEAERFSGLGWEPDLDDGSVLCAAPLAGLFAAWRDAASAREEIKAGKYPWAFVSKWADEL